MHVHIRYTDRCTSHVVPGMDPMTVEAFRYVVLLALDLSDAYEIAWGKRPFEPYHAFDGWVLELYGTKCNLYRKTLIGKVRVEPCDLKRYIT